ncbi:MAG: DUF1849 family protein [Pseudomonadota bacterium]
MKLLTVLSASLMGLLLVSGQAMATVVTVRPPPQHDAALAAGMAPHRAAYDIQLVSVRNGSQIINVTGKMTYSWEASCEGWVTNHGFKIAYEYAENPPLRIESQFSTLESLDGAKMRFSSSSRHNGEPGDVIRGHATIAKTLKNADTQSAGLAVYDLPEATKLTLPANTMFPMTHTLQVLRQAKAGQPFLSRPLFDGSDTDGITQVSAVIGKPKVLDMQARKDWPKSWPAKMRAWPLNLAFFAQAENEAGEAEYDLTAHLLENGVMREMTIAYKDFKVRHVLTKVEALPVVKCTFPPHNTLPQKTVTK